MSLQENFIFGFRAIIEAIKAGKNVDKVIIKKGLTGELYNDLFTIIREHNIPYQFVPIEKINRISQKNHQGVIAMISLIEYQNIENILPILYEESKVPLVLVLDHITDVRNFGSIARTAECAGIHAIIIPEQGAAQINSDAMKTSSGALNLIPVCRVKNLNDTLKYLIASGLQLIAATEKAKDEYTKADYTIPTAIIMGAEDTGISSEILKISEKWVKIPVYGKIESLNVSVATAVMAYEVVRQRK